MQFGLGVMSIALVLCLCDTGQDGMAAGNRRAAEERIRTLSRQLVAANNRKALAAYHRGLRALAVTSGDQQTRIVGQQFGGRFGMIWARR
jgi:hypothetical protein